MITLGACARNATPNPPVPALTPSPSGTAPSVSTSTPLPVPTSAPLILSRDNAFGITEIGSWQANFSSQVSWNAESTTVYLPNLDDVFVYDVTQSQHELISFDEFNRQNPYQDTSGITIRGNCSDQGEDLYAVSPDKTLLATGWSYGHQQPTKTVIDLWDLTHKKCLFQFPEYTGPLSALAFSPGGNYLVFSTDRATYVWDVKKSGYACRIKFGIFAAFAPGSGALAVSEMREWLGYGIGVWDVTKCELVQKYINGGLNSTFSPNEDLLATTDRSRVLILDAKTGDLIIELVGHPDDVYTLSFSPDGRYLLSGSSGGPDSISTFILWAVKH
jgi:WD40 repeat protein